MGERRIIEVRQDGADGGGFLDATIRSAPPQWVQVVTSMEKSRLRRCAHVIARRFSSGLRGSSLALSSGA